jgi:hypothetical protein
MNSNKLAFTIPISGEMINIADKLSQEKRNEQKTREVYLKTLAKVMAWIMLYYL